MTESFIILFRETAEASLIIGIVMTVLKRSDNKGFYGTVYLGVILAILSSVAGAFFFNRFADVFTERGEPIFEGLVMIISAVLLTTMILWMLKNSGMNKQLEKKVTENISSSRQLGLFFIVFTAILREGIEAVLFLSAASYAADSTNLAGAVLGILSAIVVTYLLMAGTLRLNLKLFFTLINIILILFASGLVASGIHELQEAALLPEIIEHVYNINPPVLVNGAYPLFHEKGFIGSIAKGIFGYRGSPSLLELIGYTIYILSASFAWIRIKRDSSL